jgi:hypothetical protein
MTNKFARRQYAPIFTPVLFFLVCEDSHHVYSINEVIFRRRAAGLAVVLVAEETNKHGKNETRHQPNKPLQHGGTVPSCTSGQFGEAERDASQRRPEHGAVRNCANDSAVVIGVRIRAAFPTRAGF